MGNLSNITLGRRQRRQLGVNPGVNHTYGTEPRHHFP